MAEAAFDILTRLVTRVRQASLATDAAMLRRDRASEALRRAEDDVRRAHDEFNVARGALLSAAMGDQG